VSWKQRFKLAWIRAARRGSRILLYLFQRALFMNVPWQPSENAIRRIVVYRIGNIGDILVTLPTLSAIRKRFPGAYIALLTSPGEKGAPGAEQILPLGKWFDELFVYFSCCSAGFAKDRSTCSFNYLINNPGCAMKCAT
jgi:hypothetical protein